jgi:hypothetical protein
MPAVVIPRPKAVFFLMLNPKIDMVGRKDGLRRLSMGHVRPFL